MASTYTTGLAIEIIGPGDQAGAWGATTNNNLKAIEQGIRGYSSIVLSSTSSTLDIADGSTASDSTGDAKTRSSVIEFTGASGDHTVTLQVGTVNATRASFIAINNLTAPHNLLFNAGSGDDVSIPNGYAAHVHIAGTAVVNTLSSLSIDKLSLGNMEVISNAVDDEIIIGADSVKIGDGAGAANFSSVGPTSLTLQAGSTDFGTIFLKQGTDGNIQITPHGNGEVDITKVDIAAGEIDGTIIGANSAAAGTFTTVGTTSDGAITANGSGNISSTTGTITTGGNIETTGSGNIATTGTGSITAANGLNVTAGGIDVTVGGLDLSGTGITNAGNIAAGTVTASLTGNASGSAATVTAAAQPAIRTVGTLTNLNVDNINVNANAISSTSGALTISSAAALNLNPNGGSAVLIDGIVSVDAGVVTGATSISSTSFVGALTGNVSGNVSGSSGSTTGNAATVTTNAAITGEVLTTSGNATQIASNVVDEANLKVNDAEDGHVLSANSLESGGLKWIANTAGDITGVTGGTNISVTSGTGPVPTVNLDNPVVANLTGNVTGTVSSTGLLTTSGNITTTGSGTITSAGSLTVGDDITLENGNTLGNIAGNIVTSDAVRLRLGTSASGAAYVEGPTGQSMIIGGTGTSAEVIVGPGTNADIELETTGTGTVQITGGQYLNLSGTAGSGGYGLRGTSSTLNASNKDGDGWGQVYHSGMTSGQGAYFEGTCAITTNTEQNLTTGFGSIPSLVTSYLECTTGNAGYSIGDHALISSNTFASTGSSGLAVSFDGSATDDVTVSIGSGGVYLMNKTTNTETQLVASSWQLRLKAWL